MASIERGVYASPVPETNLYVPGVEDGFDFDLVREMMLFDFFGNRFRFYELYQDKKAIIVFVRHFLCYVCKEYVEDLAKIPKESLEEANVRLVVIGCAPHTFIQDFCQETRFRHNIYCDPERDIYKALGLKTEPEGPSGRASRHVKSSVLSGVLKSTWRAIKSMQYQGDMAQQGGQFIVGPGEKLHYAWRERNTQDHTPINQLLAEAGVTQISLPKDPRILDL